MFVFYVYGMHTEITFVCLKLQSFALVMEQLLELLEESDLREQDLKGNAHNA